MKIRKNKGFTLIELLAVIVILAVIALIAIPQIMNIIKLSKRNSFKATLLNIEHAAENYRIKQELYETMIGCHYFSFSEPNKEGIDEITGKKYVKLEELDLKGKLPSTGVVEVCSDTILVNASDGKFYGKVDQEKDPIISENDEAFTDETQPTMTLSYTSTESSINAIVEASIGGHGQIQDYYFSIDDSEYVKSKSPIYTYTELESGKIYKIKAYTVSKANIKSDIHEMEAMTNNVGEIKKIVILPTEWSKEKSATIEYKFDDDNANSYIQYKITRGEEVLKDWTIYGDREIKISENTTSKICLYAKVVENEIDKPNSMIYVCTSNIDNTTPTVTLTSNVENDIWTNKDIELLANASGSISNYSYEWYYETKEGNIKLKNKENNYIITKDEERTYIVKVKNESGTYSDYSNKYIVKLDKELPTKDKPTVQIIKGETTYSLKVSNNQIDEKSKIKSIEYMLSSDGENYLKQDTDLFENLIPGKTYYVKTKAIDNALNESESDITEIELKKLPGKLTLSSNADIYTYPNSNKVEILENISGGTISIDEGTDTEVATAKLSGTELTVTPGTKEGTTTFTITSAETSQFNEARVVYVATTKKGLLSVVAMPVNVIYDGKEHSITVTSSGATIRYSKDGTTYSTTNPTYTNVGTYTVYYEVSKTGYTTVKDSKTLTITKANVTITSPTAKTLTYNGSAQNLINAGNCTGGTIKYKVGNGSYSTIIPTGTNAGSYTVAYYCEGDSNHNNSTEKTVDVKIDKASGSVTVPTVKTLTYNGSAQNLINAGSSTTGTIQYSLDGKTYSTNIPTGINAGTYTVYYRVVGDLNHTDVTAGNISVTIKKANNTLTLSANSGTYTYPTSGKFTITKNVSGGTISINAGTDTGVATAKLSGTEVTITPGTKEGTTTFTITSAETTNYNKGSVTYIATTKHGVLSVTANGYNGVYDGKAHSITVTSSGATIKYSTDGTTYSTTNPTYTNVGTYTVYYEVSKTGYQTQRGSEKVIINEETLVAPVRSSTTSDSTSITAAYSSGSAVQGIKSTNCYLTDLNGNVNSTGNLSGNNCLFNNLTSNTTYYYKKCITSNSGNVSCSPVSGILTAGGITNFDYTGNESSYKTPCTGIYKLEVWGSSGFGMTSIIANTPYTGGYGGYSTGDINLNLNQNLYINVGGSGSGVCNEQYCSGGYNGGGRGAGNSGAALVYSGPGGGATHIATVSGLLSSLKSNPSAILIVAGGGGGVSYQASSDGIVYSGIGGSGGGISGLNGTNTQSGYSFGQGGTQSSGGLNGGGTQNGVSRGNSGTFGQGGDGNYYSAGGGGGYYGGGASNQSGAGGGSGYIGNNLLTNKSMYCYKCNTSNDSQTLTYSTNNVSDSPISGYAKSFYGYARITITSCRN